MWTRSSAAACLALLGGLGASRGALAQGAPGRGAGAGRSGWFASLLTDQVWDTNARLEETVSAGTWIGRAELQSGRAWRTPRTQAALGASGGVWRSTGDDARSQYTYGARAAASARPTRRTTVAFAGIAQSTVTRNPALLLRDLDPGGSSSVVPLTRAKVYGATLGLAYQVGSMTTATAESRFSRVDLAGELLSGSVAEQRVSLRHRTSSSDVFEGGMELQQQAGDSGSATVAAVRVRWLRRLGRRGELNASAGASQGSRAGRGLAAVRPIGDLSLARRTPASLLEVVARHSVGQALGFGRPAEITQGSVRVTRALGHRLQARAEAVHLIYDDPAVPEFSYSADEALFSTEYRLAPGFDLTGQAAFGRRDRFRSVSGARVGVGLRVLMGGT